ncbi:MAG: aspartate kinase [Oscillospiraceae bacterium]
MPLIVQKFGGSSVADAERIYNVAKIITDTYSLGNDVVVVLSAQGDTTDELIAKAKEINPNASRREMDMLLSTGEQISVALCAMAIERIGFPVVSLAAWQIGLETNSAYGNARIKKLSGTRLQEELDKKNIVIVTGFQGINKYKDVTTLGRGGSDTTAVALAVALQADLCQIYTDVDGVYTADPRYVKGARKLEEITYDEMLELATLGAQVLHNRSVELGKRYGIEMEVISSFSRKPGTRVKEVVKMEQTNISGVARDDNIARISLVGVTDKPGIAYRVFSILAKNKINVDIILQALSRNGENDISFTVAKADAAAAKDLLYDYCKVLGCKSVEVKEDVSKISIVGAGMVNNSGVAADMFEALYNAGINIQMISTSEIKVSVLIDYKDAETAVQVIHDKFFPDR